MSTISKERLEQLASGNAWVCVQDDEAAELARIALASLEAEPVAWLLSGGGAKNHVSFDSGNAYADPLREVTPLYTAHPAPVSVPDELAGKSFNYIANKFEVSPSEAQWILVGWNARSAAMLQGAEPVTTDCKLPELTDSQCLEFLAVAFRHASIKGDIEFDDIRLGLKMALEAAPQQEVKP